MARARTSDISYGFVQRLNDLGALVKWRLTLTVVVSSVLGYAIAAGSSVHVLSAILLGFGGFMIAGAANAMNEILERDFDKLMTRTANRPVAAGRMPVSNAVLVTGIMLILGIVALAFFNPLTSFLGVVSFVLYAFIYTPLKRHSTVSVAVGAIPGALPVLIGCVAFDGTITWLAIVLFAIQFLWQFPHFWAIGWLAFDQYQKAGFKLLPVDGESIHPSLGMHSLLYGFLLLPVCAVSYAINVTSMLTTVLMAVVSFWYLAYCYQFYRSFDRGSARRLMFSSFGYLPMILFIIWISKMI